MGDEHPLERVGRTNPPAVWIGGWVAALVVVVAVAVAGQGPATDDARAVDSATPSASTAPVAVASPNIPGTVPRVIRPFAARAPAPRPRPTLGDDGLVGGTVYSSAPPAD